MACASSSISKEFSVREPIAMHCAQVMQGERLNTLPASGVCDHPHINADPRAVFMRGTKAAGRGAGRDVRQYVPASGRFEFGPLLAGKDASVNTSTHLKLACTSGH